MNRRFPDLGNLDPADRADAICDAFDNAWKAGEKPRLEKYLGQVTKAERSTLLCELLKVEFEYLNILGREISLEVYLARFPDDAEIVHDVFSHYGDDPCVGKDQFAKTVIDPSFLDQDLEGEQFAELEQFPELRFHGPADGEQESEFFALFRRRILTLCILGFGGWAMFDSVALLDLDPIFRKGVLGHGCLAMMLMTTLAPVVWAGMLVSRPPSSLSLLRTTEFSLLALCGLTLAWIRYATTGFALKGGATEAALYASCFNNLILLCVLIVFGVVVPNTWKRTLANASALVVPSLSAEAAGQLFQLTEVDAYLASSVIMTLLALFIGIGVSVFGSYRIERLEGEVDRSRKLLREFGHYRLIKKLGDGGMGVVFLAEHRLLKRPCAVKLIRRELSQDRTVIERFEREVEAITRLTHWNIVEIYDYGRLVDGTLYYVMEFIPGMNLCELVAKCGLCDPGRAIHILRQLCAALRELHAAGRVHRDITPRNVMLGERGGVFDMVTLLDFGLVTRGSDQPSAKMTQHGAIIGTPEFLSPEQADGTKKITPASDLYSLGAVAYFLLTGQPPFVRSTAIETIHAQLTDPVVPLHHLHPGIHEDLERVVLRCLNKSPEDRFPDANTLDMELARCEPASLWSTDSAADWWQNVGAEKLAIPAEQGTGEWQD